MWSATMRLMPGRLPKSWLLAGLLAGNTALCAAQDRSRSQAADKADFETVCGACHTPGMVSDFRTGPEWEETIEKMVSIGAKGASEQMEAVLRYLLRTLTKVNVNTADAGELPLVLDIPEAAAQALVEYRAKHGNFKTLDDLNKVPGIDPARLAARKDRIVF